MTLEGGVGEPVTAATLVDVSAGGAFVKLTGESHVADDGRLRIMLAGEPRSIGYAVVGVEETWEGTLLHVRFTDIDADDVGHLEAILGELESESTDMKRWMASGHGLLGRVQEHADRRVYIP